MGGDDGGAAPAHPRSGVSARTEVSARSGVSARTRVVVLWSVLGVLLLLAFAAAFGAAQRAFYSPAGFATSYVDALARHDVRGALSMPGADPSPASLAAQGLPRSPSRELLRADALPRLTDVRAVSDDAVASGEHRVTVRALADGHPVEAAFTVKQTGSVLGVLPTWSFSRTPLGIAHVDVEHAGTFEVAGHTLDPRAAGSPRTDGFGGSADYLVFAPSRYMLSHRSRYVVAHPVAFIPRAGTVTTVAVDGEPTAAFTDAVAAQLRRFLDDCARQHVLQPAGCPFGVDIVDRVQGDPSWRMVHYPLVRLQPGAGGWTMARAGGIAHLSATVQSLFDGTVEQRESDIPFVVTLPSVTIRPDGSLDIVVGQ